MSQIFTALPKLIDIAAASIALCLWNHFDIPNTYGSCLDSDLNYSWSQFNPEVMKFTEDFSLPNHLVKLIQTYVVIISSEMTKWIIYHRGKIPLVRKCHLFCQFVEIIWHPDFTINYKETIRNLQNSKFLNEVEKFQFLCLYCLEHEIVQKRRLFENNFFNRVIFQNHPLVYYWDRCCRNRLQDVPVTGDLSIDEFMFRHSKVDIWPAKEYFFDRMNVDEQIQNTIWIVDQSKVECQKLIMVKLDQSQLRTLYTNRSLRILTNYLSDSKYFDNILPTWFEAASTISGEDFAIFLRRLFQQEIDERIIVEVWVSVSDFHKLHVLRNEPEVIVFKIWNLWMQTYDKNSIDLLLDTDKKIIKTIRNMRVFSIHCEYLLANSNLLMLDKVLNICFKSDEAMAPIKQNLARSTPFDNLCKYLILANDFFTLDQLFRLFREAIDLDVLKKDLVGKGFFQNHCKNLVRNGGIPVLDELLDMFCSPKIKELDKCLQDCFDSVSLIELIDCCRKSIIEEKFPAIVTLLDFYRFGIEKSVRLKYFIDHCEQLKEHDELEKLENLLKSLFPIAEEFVAFKKYVSSTEVFGNYCANLIKYDELPKLEESLKLFLPCIHDLVPFKPTISRYKAFEDHCLSLIVRGQLLKLDELLRFTFPNVEESIQFKQNLSMKTFSITFSLKLLIGGEWQRYQTLLAWFYPCNEMSAAFKQALGREKVFTDYCQKLTIQDQLSKLDELFDSIFTSAEELIEFKRDLSLKKCIIDHCLKLLIDDELQKLGTLFVWLYPCIEQSVSFSRVLSQEEVFSDYCRKLITEGQLSKLDESLNSIFLNIEESVQFKQDLSTKRFFIDHCLKLIIDDDLSNLEILFIWVDPCIEESAPFKLALSKEKGFSDHCELLICSGQLSKLDELLNLIFHTADESVLFKKDISTNAFFIGHCKKLLIEGELPKLRSLLVWSCLSIEESVPLKRALSKKKAFGDHCRKLILNGQLSELDETLNFIFPSVEESVKFKQNLSTKKFFINYCLKFMIQWELQKLDSLFSMLFPRIEDVVPLKRALSKEEAFEDHCQKLIIEGQLKKLEELLNLVFPSVEESVKFKQDLSTKKFFIDHCLKLIIDDDLQNLKILFSAFLPGMEKLTRLKRLLREKNVFGDHCRSLIIGNQLPKLDELLHLLFSSEKEIVAFKKNLIENSWFVHQCQNLINSCQLTTLDQLLTWRFPDNLELNRFKNNLASSNYCKEKCLFFYRTENIEGLNNLLNLLFDHHYELIFEYKQNLLLSEDGVEVCFFLSNLPNSALEDVIIDCLPASASTTDFKRDLIFSSVAISKLKKMIQKNLLADVKKCFDRFLVSAEDRISLKKHLLNNPSELITLLFFEYDRSACESEMKWWFDDETAVHRCKRMLSIDTVFLAGLKECVFQTFDQCGRVSRCVFKEKFDFGSLDRFLNWYFESPKEIKEYKLQKIKSYQNIETINLLLKKGCRYPYFVELFGWFFENDVAEMVKFQRKHKGERITTI